MPRSLGPAAVYGWLALPNSGSNSAKELAGAAFLISSELALTCAHVIRDHLGLKATPIAAPEQPVMLRFEALDAEVKAVVVSEGWYPDGGDRPAGKLRDVAFLRLSAPLEAEGLRHLSLAPWVPEGGPLALVIGAEPGYQGMSQSVQVKLAGHRNNRGLWQVDAASSASFAVVRGFSGAPLLDERGTVIWGMVVEVDAKGRPVAFAVGADDLYKVGKRLLRETGTDARDTGYRPPDSVLEEICKLWEHVSRTTLELDAARREIEVLRKYLEGKL